VMTLRHRFGLSIPCERYKDFDRDQHRVEFGVYSLTDSDRAAVLALLQGGFE